MPFVSRRDGHITGAFEQPQYDAHEADAPQDTWVPVAVEWKDEDDAELVAFRQSLVPPIPDQNGAALDARQMTAAKEDTTASIDKISDPAIKAAFQKLLDLIQ